MDGNSEYLKKNRKYCKMFFILGKVGVFARGKCKFLKIQ